MQYMRRRQRVGRRGAVGGLLLTAVLLCCISTAGAGELGRTFLQAFDQKKTGGATQNYGVVQDSSGLIYVANLMHVLEYDGMRWRAIPHPRRLRPLAITIDSSGTIFVGFQGDFGYLQRDVLGRYQVVSLAHILPDSIQQPGYIWNAVTSGPHIYFRSPDRVYRWTPAVTNPEKGALKVWSFAEGSRLKGPFFFGDTPVVWQNEAGLVALNADGATSRLPGGEQLADIPVRCVTTLDDGAHLLLCEDIGLFTLSGGVLREFVSEADIYAKQHFATGCTPLPNGDIAMGTRYGGLAIITQQGRIVRIVDKTLGLPDDNVQGPVLVDDQWGLWAPLNYGIGRVEVLSPLQQYDFELGLEGGINSILRFDGILYVGSSQGVFFLEPSDKPGRPARFHRVPGARDRCWQLLAVHGELLAVMTDGIYEIRDPHFAPRKVQSIDMAYCAAFSPDSTRLYVGAYNQGLHVLESHHGAWRYRGKVEEASSQVLEMIADRRGNLWLMTNYDHIERVRVESNQAPAEWHVTVYDTSHGLPKPNHYYPLLLEDELLVGSVFGLHRYDSDLDQFVPDSSLGSAFGSGEKGLWNLTKDQKGRVWFNSQFAKGAYVIPGEEGSYELNYPLLRVSGTSFLCFYPEQGSDVIWAGSEDGRLIRYDVAAPLPPETPFPALVRRVTAGGDSILLDGSPPEGWIAPRLPFAYNSLRFEFAIPRYDAPRANKFQYRLVGLNDQWSPWTNEIYKDFNSLREGRYRFEVRGHGVYYFNSEVGGFDFVVLPPWYRTFWAYMLYAVLFLGGLYLLIKWEIRRVEERNRHLEHLVETRTRQLAEANTQLADANRQIQEYNETLEEKLEERTRHLIVSERQAAFGQLVQGIVHNLRNPLTTSMNSAEIMRMALERMKHDPFDSEADEKMMMQAAFDTVRKSIRWIEQANDTLNDMINTLLTKSRSDKGENMKRVDLNLLVETEMKFLEADLRFKKLAARHVELADEPLHVQVVPGEMAQVFQNLVRNAVDAMHGRKDAAIWISTWRKKETVYLELRDNGSGIPEEIQERIFDPFFSTKPAEGDGEARLDDPKGTGLGLWMCKEAMESFGGNIMVRSEEGEGATFILSMPIADADFEEEE